jgi:rod shape-determining protein MreB
MRLAIDLGTTRLRIARGKRTVVSAPSVVAVDAATHKIIAFGEAAEELIGKTPPRVTIEWPLRNSMVAHPELVTSLLRHYLADTGGWSRLVPPTATLAIPAASNGVQRRGFVQAVKSAGLRHVDLIEAPLAAAIGAGLDVSDPIGHLIIHLGGGLAEVAIVSADRLVATAAGPIGGDAIDRSIVQWLRTVHSLEVGLPSAERLKIALASAPPASDKTAADEGSDDDSNVSATHEICGRDLITGLPRCIDVEAAELRDALTAPLDELHFLLRSVLEKTPPDLAADLVDRGAILTGGGAQLRGLDRWLQQKLSLPVTLAADPATCVVRGATQWTSRHEPVAA